MHSVGKTAFIRALDLKKGGFVVEWAGRPLEGVKLSLKGQEAGRLGRVGGEQQSRHFCE